MEGRRRGGGQSWWLLTTEPVTDAARCWRILPTYAAHRRIEQTLRYGKSALGVESLRLRDWEAQHTLLALVSLAYAFLIELLGDCTCAPPSPPSGTATPRTSRSLPEFSGCVMDRPDEPGPGGAG